MGINPNKIKNKLKDKALGKILGGEETALLKKISKFLDSIHAYIEDIKSGIDEQNDRLENIERALNNGQGKAKSKRIVDIENDN